MKTARQKNAYVNIPVVFRPEPEGGFTVTVPSLPGCITYGKTLGQAKRMAQEAIELYLEDMTAEGEKFPQNTDAFLSTISAAIPHRSLTYA